MSLGRALRLALWLGYPLAAFLIFSLFIRYDPFGIFDPGYFTLFILALPTLLLLGILYLAIKHPAPHWGWSAALAFWVIAVTCGHLWVIGVAAASV